MLSGEFGIDKFPMLTLVRISVSALCLLASVLLIVLWVRSYWWKQTVSYSNPTQSSAFCSYRGGLSAATRYDHRHPRQWGNRWTFYQEPITAETLPPLRIQLQAVEEMRTTMGFGLLRAANVSTLGVPYWFLVLLFTSMTAVPWLYGRIRFSVRTLLICMMLVAVLIGILVLSQ